MPISFHNVLPRLPFGPSSALDGQTVKNRFNHDKAAFTLSDFVWESAPSDSWRASCHVINLALTPRPQPAWVSFGGAQRHTVGPIMFVPKGVEINTSMGMGRQRSLTCLLSSEILEGILGHSPRWQGDDLVKALNIRSPSIEQLMQRITRELEHPGFASALLLEPLGTALAIELIRAFRLEQLPAQRPSCALRTGGLAPWRMRRIRDRVLADAPAPDLTELSEICRMSVRQLTRAYKSETGQTLASFAQQAMMERARHMLTETERPIAEIATRLGFAGSASFGFAYRRFSGQRPSDQRRSCSGHTSEVPSPPVINSSHRTSPTR